MPTEGESRAPNSPLPLGPAPVAAAVPVALRVLLTAALAAVTWLVSPFADALLVAAVAAVVAWPLHERLAKFCADGERQKTDRKWRNLGRDLRRQ